MSTNIVVLLRKVNLPLHNRKPKNGYGLFFHKPVNHYTNQNMTVFNFSEHDLNTTLGKIITR